MHLDPELLRSRENVLPSRVAFRVGDALHLVEAGNGVAHMRGVLERLLALLRKCELGGIDRTAF